MLCEILLRLRLCCIAWQIKLEGRRWNWLGSPPRTTLNQSNHTGYYPISSGGAESTLSHTLRGGQGSNNYVQTRTIWISRFFRVVDSVLSLITVMHFLSEHRLDLSGCWWTLWTNRRERRLNCYLFTEHQHHHLNWCVSYKTHNQKYLWLNADWWSLIVLLDPL